ncbi:hypothetical protein CDL15_Pgr011610 [Punica granatum]|uniref:Uncharacterized protein n=1 Tax=Punica granatum TaxID=22663 RepID=A0A218XG71_PUNGR|nr:hypothetical protein CDL15_Pgr011610 [Punica granatum]PKI61122.1 hypothetical protein CRG98_018442 [Punica granatum]
MTLTTLSGPGAVAAAQAVLGYLTTASHVLRMGTSFLAGSRISSFQEGTYGVIKSPSLWLSLSQVGWP